MSTVLVTGGSGFIAAHIILQLLRQGDTVRTTVRKASRELDVRAMLREGGAEPGDSLGFHVADLESDAGWAGAMEGCDYVMHVASPLPKATPKHEDELIVPAREGTLRVLRAARDAGVKRTVVTSSFAAVGYGHPQRDTPYDETSWTNLHGRKVSAYTKSKTLAEKAAWDFVEKEGNGMELSVVNPTAVLGPVLGVDLSASILMVQRMLEGAVPACPRLYFGIVDVRDVADLHLRVMTHPAARGERFLAVAGDNMAMRDVAMVLKKHLGERAAKVPTRQLPDFLVRLMARRRPEIQEFVPELGMNKRASGDKARRVLGWQPHTNEEAILATAESLFRLGLVK